MQMVIGGAANTKLHASRHALLISGKQYGTSPFTGRILPLLLSTGQRQNDLDLIRRGLEGSWSAAVVVACTYAPQRRRTCEPNAVGKNLNFTCGWKVRNRGACQKCGVSAHLDLLFS